MKEPCPRCGSLKKKRSRLCRPCSDQERTGEHNNNWKGGKTLSSHGYVLIKVPTGHPLRQAHGYAYEHSVVASQQLSRALSKGELVHHLNGDKADNRPENLMVLPSNAHHFLNHRKHPERRKPNEPNTTLVCACGCKATLPKFDQWGRPRKYLTGHNLHPS